MKGPRSARMPAYGTGIKVARPRPERGEMAPVSCATHPRQFPLRPYSCFQCWFEKQPEKAVRKVSDRRWRGSTGRTRTENAGESLVPARQRPRQFLLRPYT
jgi:hypothetical protein